MGKRKKSKKGKYKSKFPHQLTIAACPYLEEQIVTDAGFESVDYLLALQYFPLEEIFNYWEYALDLSDIESEDEVEKFEELMNSTDYYSFSQEKQKELLNSIITQFSWLPSSLDIATARAVYGLDYQWVKAIAIQNRYDGRDYIDSYETEAINLGLYLKQEIGNPNLSVINDNKHAVSSINGILSFEPWFLKEYVEFLKENKPTVFWGSREFVTQADRLSIRDATRVFRPDDELFEPSYDEYYELDLE